VLTLKNIRKPAFFASYLYLVALLCLKVFIPLSHSHAEHNSKEQGYHASAIEQCFACEVEHAASLFSIETTAAFASIISCLGVIVLLTFELNLPVAQFFSLLRGPPACTIQA
jgi:hypothetical protein